VAEQPRAHQRANPVNNEIEESRDRLARAVRDTRDQLDVPRRIRRSFQERPAVWVVGAIVVGAVVMMLPRNKTVYVAGEKNGKGKSKILETGFLLSAARIAATLLKPAVIGFIRSRLSAVNARPDRTASRW
jgi:hypothetical protein